MKSSAVLRKCLKTTNKFRKNLMYFFLEDTEKFYRYMLDKLRERLLGKNFGEIAVKICGNREKFLRIFKNTSQAFPELLRNSKYILNFPKLKDERS